MKHFLRHYSLELLAATVGILIIAGLYHLFDTIFKLEKDRLAFVGVLNAGLLFVAGHVYSRLKDRRDAKRKRSLDLLYEWHSKDMRESRMYISRWKRLHNKKSLPALGATEEAAIKACVDDYKARQTAPTDAQASSTIGKLDPYYDPDQEELHFFRIYQFFERWSLLVENGDIDQESANGYMGSYKSWYLANFIEPWHELEKDEHILKSLARILKFVAPPFKRE
jgi:hypothetical protein